MKYDQIKRLADKKFRRLTVVKHSTFSKMVEIIKDAEQQKKALGGRKNKLSIEN